MVAVFLHEQIGEESLPSLTFIDGIARRITLHDLVAIYAGTARADVADHTERSWDIFEDLRHIVTEGTKPGTVAGGALGGAIDNDVRAR